MYENEHVGESVQRAPQHVTGNHVARAGAQTRGDPNPAHARVEQIGSSPNRRSLSRTPLHWTGSVLVRDIPCLPTVALTNSAGADRRYRMNATKESIEERIDRLHSGGIVDFHFDLLIDLYEKRDRPGVLVSHFLPEFEAGDVGVLGVAIYVEDRYLSATGRTRRGEPETGLRVALDQVARLYAEVEQSDRFAICETFAEIEQARAANKIALVITMEGVEPLGEDLNLLRAFYELGLRSVGLTHARRNAAGSGGIFKPSGSPRDGLTNFGRDVVRECERLGIVIDLAHINPKGFED